MSRLNFQRLPSVDHALEFDGVDFNEPMEVELEEAKPAVKDEGAAAETAAKVEPKAEPINPVLL